MKAAKIPTEVFGEYDLGENQMVVEELGGGLIHNTYLVQDEQYPAVVLQRINPIIQPEQAEDYAIISEQLSRGGWDVPRPLMRRSGEYTYTDNSGATWRANTFIP